MRSVAPGHATRTPRSAPASESPSPCNSHAYKQTRTASCQRAHGAWVGQAGVRAVTRAELRRHSPPPLDGSSHWGARRRRRSSRQNSSSRAKGRGSTRRTNDKSKSTAPHRNSARALPPARRSRAHTCRLLAGAGGTRLLPSHSAAQAVLHTRCPRAAALLPRTPPRGHTHIHVQAAAGRRSDAPAASSAPALAVGHSPPQAAGRSAPERGATRTAPARRSTPVAPPPETSPLLLPLASAPPQGRRMPGHMAAL